MTAVAILGAGAGGCAAAVELAQRGYGVRLWSRRAETIAPLRTAGGIAHTGVLGDGFVAVEAITDDLAATLDGADLALVCVPATGVEHVARALAAQRAALPVVLNPGGLGGCLQVRACFEQAGVALPPLAELSTLAYVARKPVPDRVSVTNRNTGVAVACLPGGEAALDRARELYPTTVTVSDVLISGLSNANMVLHAPGAVLGLAWVEATDGAFRFYSEGVTDGVGRVIRAFDDERLAVLAALGHTDCASMLEIMQRAGLVDEDAARAGDWAAAIRGGVANAGIAAPESTRHRYYAEDVGYALAPFVELATTLGVEVPVARSLLTLVAVAAPEVVRDGLTAQRLGIAGLDAEALRRLVRRPSST